MRMKRSVWRDSSAAWGPAAFALASVLAARRQPGYLHRRHHISGLAAQYTRSAVVMIPGFVALGAASLMTPSDHRGERVLLRVAGMGTIAAGLFRCSDIRCPDPTKDPQATSSDTAHAIGSIVTFIAWTVLPFADPGRRRSPTWRAITVGNGAVTACAFVAAGLTQQSDSPNKGVAQRVFIGSVFAWYLTHAYRRLSRPSD